MTFAKIVLGFNGVLFAVYGVYCVFALEALADFTGLAYARPGGYVEAGAMYGGLQTGLGLFLLYAVWRPKLVVPALVAMLFMLAGLALTRLGGLTNHGADPYNLTAVVYELVTVALVAAALRRESGAGAAAAA